MAVIGLDNREVIDSFGTFPFSTVTTVDAQFTFGNFINTGITIAPNHVLTAGHNAYKNNNNATALRTTTSTNEDALNSRIIGTAGDPPANATNVNFLASYDTTELPEDDIALFTTSDAPIAASDVIGLIAFVDPTTAAGLTIDTAGYPGDNVPNSISPSFNNPGIPGNSGQRGRDLVRSPDAAESPAQIQLSNANGFSYDEYIDTFRGQSGSGVWHTLNGDDARVLGVHTQGNTFNTSLGNSGVLITTDIYDQIMDQIETDSGTANANELPENAIIGTGDIFSSSIGLGNDDIFGSYRRERIIGYFGNDRLFGGGADDRLEGGDGVDQALFSEIFTNYDFTITDPSNPAFEFTHARGSQSDGTDTTKDIEFGVFEFVDVDDNGTDDDGNLFFVPLQVDPDDNTKLKDGPSITPEEDILDNGGNKIGKITVESPAWMFDGDVNYTLNIGSEQEETFNFAYIIDTSGSMGIDGRLDEAKAAYGALTNFLQSKINNNSVFSVVDFDSSARLFNPEDSSQAISIINGLPAGGNTNFNSALVEAQNFFNSPSAINNATNIAYFLSDGLNNGPNFSSSAAQLQQLAEVRAFGIGNADIDQLNIVDSDNAVLLLDSDITEGFDAAIVDKNTIERIDVKLGGTVVDTITPDQLVEDTLGLKFEGTIDGLEVTREAENEITFDVVFKNVTPTASLDYKITTGQEQVTQQTDNGTKQIITFSVNQADFTGSPESGLIGREIIANDLDNVIEVESLENTIFGNGGNDRFILEGGVNLVNGGEGIDTAQINKTRAEAGDVSKKGNVLDIGTENTLLNVEFIEFSDVRLAVDTLAVTPTLSLANQGISITEGNTGSTTATFTINLSSTTTEDVVIDFTTRSNDADAAADFAENTGQLTIAAGESSGDITLEILGDTDIEGDESVFLDLSVVSGGTFADGATTETAGVNILDDDSAISVPITGEDPTVVEGNPDTPSTFTLTLDRFGGLIGTDTIKVEIIAAGDNPAQGSDFVDGFSSREVTFAPGEDTKIIGISINPDQEIEDNETFGVKLTSVSGSALVPNEDLIFTILNDDQQPPQPVVNQIIGTENDDGIVGTPGSDEIFGKGGNDSLSGGASNDTLDGGEGEDTVIFSDNFENYDYEIDETTQVVTVTHARGTQADGTDTLKNIEFAQFGDRAISLTSLPYAAWWKLDETSGEVAVDNAGTNNGSLINSPSRIDAVVNNGLAFDGVDDFVRVADSDAVDFGTGDFSVSAWVKTSDSSGVDVLLDKRVEQSGNTQGYSLYLFNGNLGIQLAEGVTQNSYTNYNSNIFVADEEWHQVSVTVDRDSAEGGKWYLDGNLAGTFTPTSRQGSLSNSKPLTLGQRSDSTNKGSFKGNLDEVRLFDEVLSATEVGTLYDIDTETDEVNEIFETSASDEITGTDGDDVITGGQGGNIITKDGNDILIYHSIDDTGDTVTDFEIGRDKFDFSQLLDSFDYMGTDPFADGYLEVINNGSTSVITIDPDGAAGLDVAVPFVSVQNLAAQDLNSADNFVLLASP